MMYDRGTGLADYNNGVIGSGITEGGDYAENRQLQHLSPQHPSPQQSPPPQQPELSESDDDPLGLETDSDAESDSDSEEDGNAYRSDGKGKKYTGISDMITSGLDKVGKDPLVLMLIFIVVNLQAFYDTVMSRFSGAVINSQLTTKGTFIQGMLMVLAYTLYKLLDGYVF